MTTREMERGRVGVRCQCSQCPSHPVHLRLPKALPDQAKEAVGRRGSGEAPTEPRGCTYTPASLQVAGAGCRGAASKADAKRSPQNKCFRDWPELPGSQEFSRVHMRVLGKGQAQGYCVRELQVWRPGQVSLAAVERACSPPLGHSRKPSCASASSSHPGVALTACPAQEEPQRTVQHFQYFGWPDYGVRADPAGVLGFRDEVNRAQSSKPQAGPMVVHFSCGGAGPRGLCRCRAGLRHRRPEDDPAGLAAALGNGADGGSVQVHVPGAAAAHPGRVTAPARAGGGRGPAGRGLCGRRHGDRRPLPPARAASGAREPKRGRRPPRIWLQPPAPRASPV
ncbi:uncharacterized protein LOC129398198 [Pan paniscus]|uniref:uncharacterized protein LOC129398198 n=1 Tax=Pan paniscus TaxID=9597 RepID=UPI00243636D1|nr:uncharacterized protein LOC129398198 [Pan paniscus]